MSYNLEENSRNRSMYQKYMKKELLDPIGTRTFLNKQTFLKL